MTKASINISSASPLTPLPPGTDITNRSQPSFPRSLLRASKPSQDSTPSHLHGQQIHVGRSSPALGEQMDAPDPKARGVLHLGEGSKVSGQWSGRLILERAEELRLVREVGRKRNANSTSTLLLLDWSSPKRMSRATRSGVRSGSGRAHEALVPGATEYG